MGHDEQRISLLADDAQLRVKQAGSPQELLIDWRSIRRVVAYKRDLLTHDLLCLALELDSEEVIELDESMTGWSHLLDALPARLPGAISSADWYRRVVFPAFAESGVEVFAR